MFLLFANPTDTTAQVETQYLLSTGSVVTKVYPIPPFTRVTKNVAVEDPLLADAAVSDAVHVQNDVPIIVERSTWWPHGQPWYEAHNAVGATKTGTRWALADGEVGVAPANTQTYLLVANTSPFAATVRATILSSERAPLTKDFLVPAHSRFNINTQVEFPGWTGNFSAIIESLGVQPAQIVVERAMYFDANGVVWAAGSDLLATLLQ